MGRCHQAFSQTHGMYNIERERVSSDANCRLGLVTVCPRVSPVVTNALLLGGDAECGESALEVGGGMETAFGSILL